MEDVTSGQAQDLSEGKDDRTCSWAGGNVHERETEGSMVTGWSRWQAGVAIDEMRAQVTIVTHLD